MKKLLFIFISFFIFGCQNAIDNNGYTYDPLESVNRKMFAFNETLDSYIVKPVAKGYDTVTPSPIKTAVRNFFGNLGDVRSLANSILQLKFEQSLRVASRVIDNTVFGLGGIFDVATPMGNPKINEDFGKTLAHYGVKSGPFLMLPIFGPSTVRDSLGQAVDSQFISPLGYVKDDKVYWGLWTLDKIQLRTLLFPIEESMPEGSDKYAFLRDGWLQYRFAQVTGQTRTQGEQDAIDAIFEAEFEKEQGQNGSEVK